MVLVSEGSKYPAHRQSLFSSQVAQIESRIGHIHLQAARLAMCLFLACFCQGQMNHEGWDVASRASSTGDAIRAECGAWHQRQRVGSTAVFLSTSGEIP